MSSPGSVITRLSAAVDDGEGGRLRITAELDDRDRLMIDEPELTGVKDLPVRQRLAEALLRAILREAQGRQRIARAEARLGDGAHEWAATLQLAGFVEVQRSHVFARTLGDGSGDVSSLPGVTLREASTFDDAVLQSLVADSELGSADRLALDPFDPPAQRLHAMRDVAARGVAPTPWWVAVQDGQPVGFIFNVLAGSPPQLAGWVLLVGTRPAARGKGIAGHLLRAALQDFAERGAAVAMALIDDHNAPSRAAFGRAGFTETPGGLRTFRSEGNALERLMAESADGA